MVEIVSYWLDHEKLKEFFPDRNIIHDFPFKIPNNGYKNIYIQTEPDHVINQSSFLLNNFNKFEFIYTWNENLLKICPNSKKYIFGTLRTPPREYLQFEKEFKISNLAGSKNINNASGYLIRLSIHYNQNKFTGLPAKIIFFRSYDQVPHVTDFGDNPFIKETKHDLFETFQFAIIVENEKHTNWFSEKLVDCLRNKTIPIYYGCPNVSDFFDTSGWIFFDTIEELVIKLQTLDENYYNRYLKTIEYNYNKCEEFSDFYMNLKRCVS
jgi:hypothetical protein